MLPGGKIPGKRCVRLAFILRDFSDGKELIQLQRGLANRARRNASFQFTTVSDLLPSKELLQANSHFWPAILQRRLDLPPSFVLSLALSSTKLEQGA